MTYKNWKQFSMNNKLSSFLVVFYLTTIYYPTGLVLVIYFNFSMTLLDQVSCFFSICKLLAYICVIQKFLSTYKSFNC